MTREMAQKARPERVSGEISGRGFGRIVPTNSNGPTKSLHLWPGLADSTLRSVD